MGGTRLSKAMMLCKIIYERSPNKKIINNRPAVKIKASTLRAFIDRKLGQDKRTHRRYIKLMKEQNLINYPNYYSDVTVFDPYPIENPKKTLKQEFDEIMRKKHV